MQAAIGRLVQFLIRMEVIREEDAEIYQYGFWSGFLLAANVLVSVILLAVTGRMESGLLYMFFLICLRSYAGGYHSDSALRCFFLSQGSLVVSAFLADWLYGKIGGTNRWYFFISAFVMALVIIRFAPYEAKSKPLSDSEKSFYKKVVAGILLLLAGLAAIRMYMGYYRVLAVWCVLDLSVLVMYLAAVVKGAGNDTGSDL